MSQSSESLPGADDHPLTWLDDHDSPAAKEWAGRQRSRTDAALDASGLRDRARSDVRAVVDRPRRELVFGQTGVHFQRRREPGQEQSSLWVCDAEGERLLIDPLQLDPTGATAITMVSPSPSGRYVAWACAVGGSDWQSIRIREVATGTDLPEKLDWIKAPQAAWDPDEAGFCYLGFERPDVGNVLVVANDRKQVRHHVLGASQALDTVVFEHPSANWLSVHAPKGLGRLVIEVVDGTTVVAIVSALREDALRRGTPAFVPIVSGTTEVSYIGATADEVVYCAFGESPDGDFTAVSPAGGASRLLNLPEGPVDVWRAVVSENHLVAAYHSGADHRLARVRLDDGEAAVIAIPDGLHVAELQEVEDADIVRMRLVGYDLGEWDVDLDLTSGEWTTTRDTRSAHPNRIERIEAVSADGVRVPMVLVHRHGAVAAGPRPTLMVGYGGYGADFLTYGFEEWHQAWLDGGGALALVGIRGGSEYGEAWHEAALREGKQRSYDDAIACAEELIVRGVTTPAMLAINGMSNGGLMVGAVLTQRPELFGATVPEVGVMDLLRFHEFTVGAGWIREFGDPGVPADYARLASISPLHNLREGVAYPPTLVVTADHDDRVVPGAHSYRFFARLLEVTGDDPHHLLRIEPNAGHAVGRSTSTVVRERGDILTFLRMTIGADAETL